VGLQEVLVNENIPIWGSCGGAQVLGLLLDPGCQNPWDCPRCRENHSAPYSPIYGHIGYTNPSIEPTYCGDTSNAIYEIGPKWVTKVTDDPAFQSLGTIFRVNEYHMGQLNYLPAGWHLVVTNGSDTYTENQCFRKNDRYIYGSQFHIENYDAQTWPTAITIMTNFLNLSKEWGGYQH
jgi:gamma-glutamyl-gamma-aminobutyrate hydrolase PuuD